MIKINALHKYFNKNKRNELHVLNDVNLTFESQGLVVLLGESGSGKTTLLNVMGGMDTFYQGAIQLKEDKPITKYRSSVWDEQRMKHIGMVFQNYYLLPSETVYENIALTLRMIGVTDTAEIEKRITYLLEAVHMEKYRKRKASQLSGGEQQRVALARALAKNPQLILADEPTGNLDSKNTIGIMNIIKQISKKKLVVMVTHERNLANFYADRIIEVADGKIIKDEPNTPNGRLDYTHETDVYLKDLTHHKITNSGIDLDFYSDGETTDFKARLIVKNNALYLDVDNTAIKKFVNIKDRPDINLYDKSIEDDVDEDIKPFQYENLIDDSVHHKPVNPVSFKHVIQQTSHKFFSATKGQKLLFFGFAIAAMVFAQSISNIFNIITVRDEDFITYPRETIEVSRDVMDYDAVTSLESFDSISGYALTKTHDFLITHPTVYYRRTFYGYDGLVNVTTAPLSQISSRDLSYGRMPENPREIVVDEAWINKEILMKNPFHALGINETHHVLEFSFDIVIGDDVMPFDIVGISDTDTPVVYAHEAFIYQLIYQQQNIHPLGLIEDVIDIVAGDSITADNEILLPYTAVDNPDDFSPFEMTILSEEMTVVGLYDFIDNTTEPIFTVFSDKDVEQYHFKRPGGTPSSVLVYANNIDQAIKDIESEGFDAVHIYGEERMTYYRQQIANSMPNLIFSGLVIAATAISFFFVIRSSMIDRIYEIGVYRSLGTKKRHIVKRFTLETIVITTFSSAIGFGVMSYILYSTQRALGDMIRVSYVSILSVLTGLVLIYAINVISGLIPVGMLLKKTPAEINTQYDL